MTATKVYRGRCPRCCPDGGACFERWGAAEKRCNNCHLVLPFRAVKPTGRPTPAAERALERVMVAFGGEVTERRMIGRKLWITAKNPARHMTKGDMLYGAIGPCGKLELTLCRLYGDAKIRDDIDISVYLR